MAALFFALAGAFSLLGERGAMWVSGFNSLPAEERARYDQARIVRDIRNDCLAWGAVMAAGAILSGLLTAWAGGAAFLVWAVLFFRTVRLDARGFCEVSSMKRLLFRAVYGILKDM